MKDFNFKLDIVKSLEKVKSGDRIIIGYASTFDVDSDDMQITREALEGAKDDLLTYSTVLFNHDMDRPIGKVVDTEVDDIGLLVKVILSKEEDEIWKKVQEGVLCKFSIKGRMVETNPVEGKDQILQITKIKLFEVSLVTVPANEKAKSISYWIAKSMKDIEKKTLAIEEIETSSNTNETMDEFINKLKEILKSEDVKEKLEDYIKSMEVEDDLTAKLEIIAGKLSGDDKKVLDIAVDALKRKEMQNDYSDKNMKTFNFGDESETQPVFQLNNETKEVELDDNNRFRKQILKTGKWFHWDAEGGVLNITEEVIDNIIKNFKKTTIEHVYVPLSHTNEPDKNAGEVVKLEKTESGLDAIIEIKDESIAEKIKKGLIKCISASLDPNYRVKTTNKFVGPTLLHAALVAEPFIKGMSKFITLSDEHEGRRVVQLDDEEPNLYVVLKAMKDVLNDIDTKTDKIEQLFVKLNEDGTVEDVEEESTEETTDEKTEETNEEEKTDEEKETEEETKEEVEEKNEEEKESDEIKKELSDKEKEEIEKSTYNSCMSREMKAGKTMAEASKKCKTEAKKSIKSESEETSGDKKPEDESELEKTAKQDVDLAEAEKEFEKYLNEGKLVPAQKEVFIELLTSGKNLQLSDGTVGITKLIEALVKSSPSLNFEEEGVTTDDETEEETKEKVSSEEVPSEAKEFFSKMGLSEEDTIKSWSFAKEQKREYDEESSTIFD